MGTDIFESILRRNVLVILGSAKRYISDAMFLLLLFWFVSFCCCCLNPQHMVQRLQWIHEA